MFIVGLNKNEPVDGPRFKNLNHVKDEKPVECFATLSEVLITLLAGKVTSGRSDFQTSYYDRTSNGVVLLPRYV